MHLFSRFTFLISLLTLSILAVAEPLSRADKSILRRMQQFVDDQTISGAVTLVGDDKEIIEMEATGFSDLASKRPMKKDDLFWIASMTKPITATAIMILADEGKLSVDDPVEKHLPEFKDQWLVDSRANDAMSLKKPARPITIRDLLTHTSGLADEPAPRPHSTLGELVMAYSQLPLKFPPGSKWEYCNSGINTLGRIVEVVAEQPIETFFEQRIFRPLGMKNTTFWPSAGQAKRVAKSYEPGPDKTLKETAVFVLKGDNLSDRDRTPYPMGGLYSTASDMYRFYRMMLNGGRWDGKRIVSEKSVKELTRTQTGDLKTGFVDGMSFGFGFAVVKQPVGITAPVSSGTFGHGGAYGTQSWADPEKNLVMILMIQRAKLPNADNSDIRKAFQELAVEQVAARRSKP